MVKSMNSFAVLLGNQLTFNHTTGLQEGAVWEILESEHFPPVINWIFSVKHSAS